MLVDDVPAVLNLFHDIAKARDANDGAKEKAAKKSKDELLAKSKKWAEDADKIYEEIEALKYHDDYAAIQQNIQKGERVLHQAFLPVGFLGGDLTEIARPVTKWSARVLHGPQLLRMWRRAVKVAIPFPDHTSVKARAISTLPL